MKYTLLSLFAVSFFLTAANAQKKEKQLTAYAITAHEKGGNSWNEVKLVDIKTGMEIQSVYHNSSSFPVLNARTGKPVVKKDITIGEGEKMVTVVKIKDKTYYRRTSTDKPFSTNSAACAYDRKHNRLYYVPMAVNQLRYIDLKSKDPSIKYFEDEEFGAMTSPGDYKNQITRMSFAADGKGYALTNDCRHLYSFTTNKKAQVTDLGALTDDASNGSFSVHSRKSFGGDMVADESGNLYLVTANRAVFKINIETRTATYKGSITGLPDGFTANGAVVEEGTSIIICSASSTSGYYKFDLRELKAEKVSGAETVFNASDLANANLISEKKNPESSMARNEAIEEILINASSAKMMIYPNPVTNGTVNLVLNGYTPGNYDLQFMDASGKILRNTRITISHKSQAQQFRLPLQIAKGDYILKLAAEDGHQIAAEKILVQ